MTSNTTEDQPEAVNVIDGFIPNEFLVEATAHAFKFNNRLGCGGDCGLE